MLLAQMVSGSFDLETKTQVDHLQQRVQPIQLGS